MRQQNLNIVYPNFAVARVAGKKILTMAIIIYCTNFCFRKLSSGDTRHGFKTYKTIVNKNNTSITFIIGILISDVNVPLA